MEDSDKPEYPRNIIGILRKMIETTTRLDSVQNSTINYLHIIADNKDARQSMVGVRITEPLLRCLRTPGVNIEALDDVLEKIAGHKSLCGEIAENGKILAEMLSSEYPVEILHMTATFKSLSSHRENTGQSGRRIRITTPMNMYTFASQAIKSIIEVFDM
ncbi:hypothetical protein BD769DRAFT_1772177 [Suillus cothurnatus]|nr:hypothetical protein BD769DRAFT_1772177 [Suillus cothurnatus]